MEIPCRNRLSWRSFRGYRLSGSGETHEKRPIGQLASYQASYDRKAMHPPICCSALLLPVDHGNGLLVKPVRQCCYPVSPLLLSLPPTFPSTPRDPPPSKEVDVSAARTPTTFITTHPSALLVSGPFLLGHFPTCGSQSSPAAPAASCSFCHQSHLKLSQR